MTLYLNRINCLLLALHLLLLAVLPLHGKDTDEERTRKMLESILKSAPSGIGVVENRVIVQVNDYILDLTGYTREELIGKNARILYPNQRESEYVGREKYRQISEKGTGSVETRWLRKDGTIRHVILSSTPLNPADLSEGVTFTVLDITDRKRAEERFARAFASSPAALVISEITTGRFIDVNDRWLEMLGYSREEMIGRTSKDVGIWSDPVVRDRIVSKLLEQGFFKDEPVQFLTRSGQKRHALWSAEVITLDGRKVMLSLLLDETARREAESALLERTTWFITGAGLFCLLLIFLIFRLSASLKQQRAQAEELESFFSVNLDLLCIADLDGNFVKTNEAWSSVLGYSMEELSRKKFLEFVHPEDLQATLDAMANLGKGDDILNFTNRYRCRDGSYRYIEWRSHPMGNLIYASARDITDRKRAEETLQQSEARFRSIIKNSPVGFYIYSLDKEDRLIFSMYNPAADNIIGISHEQFMGSSILDAFPALAGTGVPEMFKAVAKGEKKTQNFEIPYDSGGIKGVYEVRVFQGEPGQTVVNFTDISGRKQLEQMNQTFVNIIKRSRDFIGIANPGKEAFFVNPAGQAMVGLEGDDEVSKTVIEDYFLEEDLPFLRETILPALFSESRWFGEFRFRHFKSGLPIPVLYDLFLAEDPETGELTNITTITRDITDLKLAEEKQIKLNEQLHHSQKMDAIGQLAGGIAHDFNNILAGIIGFAELLQGTESLSEKQQKYTSKIITAADRAGNLAKKLLTFSRRGIKASSTIDCAKIIIDTIEILKRTIDKKIELSFENKAEISLIVGDDSILQNVFLNISINAAQAMPHGGKLIFTIDNVYLERDYCDFLQFDIQSGEFVEISIRDTGTGMPQEILSRIFEPFFTTKEPGKGTGLGLAMVYSAIQEHSGAVNVYSEEGRGTIFHIYLPVSEHAQIDAISPHPLTRGSGTILLIDDEELMRLSAAAMLESIGYTVIQAENGKHGLEIFEKQSGKIDLVILDMIMPVMGGRETFGKIKGIDPHIPVIISSGFTKEEEMISLKEQGISGFLQKPFRSAELSEKVNKAISNNTSQENIQ